MKALPPLRSLQAFRAAANQMSFKAAAETMNVSQAAMSTQIRNLESFLGIKLFERLTREVRLTREGRELHGYVEAGFAEIEKGIALFADDPEPHRLTVATLPSFATKWLMPKLGDFQRRYPRMRISLVPSLELTDFQKDGIDLAIRFGQGRYQGLTSRKLMEETFVPVCHPSLITNPDAPLEERLSSLPWMLDDSQDVQKAWQDFQNQAGISIPDESIKVKVKDASTLVEAVLSGQGASLLRKSLVEQPLDSGLLSQPADVAVHADYQFYLVAPEAKFRQAKVRAFVTWIENEIQPS